MSFIITILLYLGIIGSPEQVTQKIINENQGAINTVLGNKTQMDGIVVAISDEQ